MTPVTDGQHLNAPQNSVEATLPVSGKKIVITAPTWGLQKKMNREARDLKYSDEDASALNLIRTTTFDGKSFVRPEELDDFDVRDTNYLSKKYMEMVDISDKDEKNA